MFSMSHLKNKDYARAYIRPLLDCSLQTQRKVIADSWPDAALYIEGEMADARGAWVRALRPDETAVVTRLDIIATPRRNGSARPTVDFAKTLARLADKASRVVDIDAGISSEDGDKWHELIAWATNKVASGRSLPRKRAKKMAAARWARAKPGTVARWKSPHMAEKRERWASHWFDSRFNSKREAWEALPEEIRQEIGSPASARRIFEDD